MFLRYKNGETSRLQLFTKLQQTRKSPVERIDVLDLIPPPEIVGWNLKTCSVPNHTDHAKGPYLVVEGDHIGKLVRWVHSQFDPSIPMHLATSKYICQRVQITVRVERQNFLYDKELINEPQATRWLGPSRHVIAYPVRKHELFNVVLLHPDRHGVEESWTMRGSKEEMKNDYLGWDRRVTKLIDLAPDDEVLEWKLCLHSPLKTWIRGSVALIGDACHPML